MTVTGYDVPMANNGTPVPREDARRVRKAVDEFWRARVANEIGVSVNTLTHVTGGLPVSAATRALVRAWCEAQEKEATK